MKTCTLCILVNEHSISLGMKKRSFGKGKYNGYGGHVEDGENIEEAARRELYEETSVHARALKKVAELTYTFPEKPEFNQVVHVYLVTTWEGEPKETEEMSPSWFPLDKIPYEQMWDNDKHWLPLVLAGKNVKGSVTHDGNKTNSLSIDTTPTF